MAAKNSSVFSVRTGRPGEGPKDADLAHARATDPDGALVAVDREGRVCGSAAAAVREDVLLLLALEVHADCRGQGAGRALLAAARAYGEARGAPALEVLAPADPAAVSFFLSAGLSVRALVLGLAAEAPAKALASSVTLEDIGPGAPLSGWIAALDRETRGFARPRDWARWASEGRVVSLKRGGRAVALGAFRAGASGVVLGPVAARTPGAAAELLAGLASLAPGPRLSLAIPAEGRELLVAAGRLGFRAVSMRALLADERRGDLRRYAGGGGLFF